MNSPIDKAITDIRIVNGEIANNALISELQEITVMESGEPMDLYEAEDYIIKRN